MSFLSCFSGGGKASVLESEITVIELNNPNVNSETTCDRHSQIDSEAMFIDPYTNNGYLIQKVHADKVAENCCSDFTSVSIFKVSRSLVFHNI